VLSRITKTWRTVLGRKKWEQDLEDELRLHVELRAADLMRSGVPEEAAGRQARIEFGSRERYKDEVRAAWWLRELDEFSQNLHYALRGLRRSPLFAAVVAGTLALGIGANTALFSIVNTLLLKDLPYKHANRLVYVTEYWPQATQRPFWEPLASSLVLPPQPRWFRRFGCPV
jgi:putative ABC transport system permease protein